MGVLDTQLRAQPTAEDGALRIKRTLAQAFLDIESSLEQMRTISRRHGPAAIHAALGSDASEVAHLYDALKAFIEQHKPGTTIEDLPTAS